MKKKTWVIIIVLVVVIGGGLVWGMTAWSNMINGLSNNNMETEATPTAAATTPTPTPTNSKDYSKILADVNKWQADYFENVVDESGHIEFPREWLFEQNVIEQSDYFKGLEKEVKDKPFYQNWVTIAERNSSFLDVNNDAQSRNAKKAANEMDVLLNSVYQQIRREIPEKDFKELQKAEQKWLDDCEKFANDGKFTLSKEVSFFEWSAKSFRTLVLLKYFG